MLKHSLLQTLLMAVLLSGLSFNVAADATASFLIEESPVTILPSDQKMPVVTLYKNGEEYSLNSSLMILEDKDSQWTIDDVSSSPLREQFELNEEPIPNLGLTHSTLWFAIHLNYPLYDNNTEENKRWYLEIGRSHLQIAELYIPQADGTFLIKQADLRKSFNEREIVHGNSVFPLTTKLGQAQTIYLRVKSDNALLLPFTLWTPRTFAEKVAFEDFIYGVFFGGLLILMLYNLFVYFSVLDTSYLFFVLYLLGITLFEFIEIGHGVTLFDNAVFLFKHSYVPTILWLTWTMMILFTRRFLNTRRYHKNMDGILKSLIAAIALYGVSSFFVDTAIVRVWLAAFTMFTLLFMLSIGIYSWAKNNENARYFTFGWLITVIGGTIYTGTILKLLPATPLNLASAPISLLLGAITISFSLADRIKRMQKNALIANERAMTNLARFRSVFNNAVEGLYRMSVGGRFVSANPSLAKMLGYETTDALIRSGKEAFSICYPNPAVQYAQLSKTGRLQGELSFRRKDGKTLWVNHSAQVIYDSEGKPSHIEGMLTDITERREKERAEHERELDKMEKEMAKASAAAKGDFLANMSHEIRTPLTAIIGYSESLNDAVMSDAEEKQAIDTVIRSSHHLLSLINDILDFSKVEASIVEVEKVPVNLFLLMKDVLAYFAMKASNQKLSFNIDYHYPLPNRLTADPTRLKQILLNLCSNALKFTKHGGVTVDVSWNEQRQLTQFSVVDTGTGLTEAQLGKLFQVYSQAEASTARQFGGTGLGLVISKQLAEMMGGTIEVESTPGVGSRFTVFIGGDVSDKSEWITSEAGAKRASESTISIDSAVPALTGEILYAEDNPDSQWLISLMLKETGAELTLVNNGQEALDAVREKQFDLILMDIKMPVMNGVDAARALRAQGYDKPIYAVTANVIKGETSMYETGDFNGLIGKPIDRTQFYQALESHLAAIK